jgi:hypothetical protein
MSIDLDINERDVTGLGNMLGDLAKRAKDPRPFLKMAALYLTGVSQQSFRDQQDPQTHSPWPKLSQATLRQRRKGGKGAQRNIDSGRMRKSIKTLFINIHGTAIGPTVGYAEFPYFGTKHITPAKFLGVDSEGLDELEAMMLRHWTEKV